MSHDLVDPYAEKMDSLIENQDLSGIEALISEMQEKVYGASSTQAYHYYIVGVGCSELVKNRMGLWGNEYSGLAVKFYKKAIFEDGFKELSADLQSRVYTNLGNQFCFHGRILEGIQQFNKAILIFDNPIAKLAKGRYLLIFSQHLFDRGHSFHFKKQAYHELKYIWDCRGGLFDKYHLGMIETDEGIGKFVKEFGKVFDLVCEHYPHLETLQGRQGSSRKEKEYLRWCAEEQLFINDLNDISTKPVVRYDTLSFPSVLQRVNPLLTVTETLALSSAFSEIKYLYAFSRFNYFDALTSKYSRYMTHHYADANINLTNSLDSCLYRRDIEMLKLTFKSLYSCFDKIATLIVMYMGFDNKKSQYFSGIWYHRNDQGKKKRINPAFEGSDNPFFLALYWLSREINDSEEEGHGYWTDSNATRMADIRNKLEHSGFRVVIDDMYKITSKFDSMRSETSARELIERLERNKLQYERECDEDNRSHLEEIIRHDEECLSEKEYHKGYPLVITDIELQQQTLRLMKKVRYALIYLALAVNYEEERYPQDEMTYSMPTPRY